MRKILLIAFSVVFFSCQKENVESKIIDQNEYVVTPFEASRITKKFLEELNQAELVGFKTNIETNYDSNNLPASYIVHSEFSNKKYFTIVSADKRADELVLGFGENDFNLNSAPEQFKKVLDKYSENVSNFRKTNLKSPESINNFESRISNFSTSTFSKNTASEVAPLTQTLWGQGCVYNGRMPKKGSIPSLWFCKKDQLPCGRAYTGCVQTAVSQVVNFYQSMADVNYGLLKNEYQETETDTKSGLEVAELMKSVATIMKASYKCDGTSALSDKMLATNSVKSKLGFKNSLTVSNFDSSDINTRETIISELKSNNLIMFSGYDENVDAGHLWIADGYKINSKGTMYLSFNWGWNGRSNGWFLYRGTFGNQKYSFSSNQKYYSGFRKA